MDDTPPAHIPVLLDEAVDALAIEPDGIYVDATFGRGGHSRKIMSRLGDRGRLLAVDRDPAAVDGGRRIDDARLELVQARFSSLDAVLDQQGIKQVNGVLADLGVSSPQLDQPERGFSFQHDGPLDMRMDPSSGVSAAQWLSEASEQVISEVIKTYGEERFARPIAKAIVARREDASRPALQTTKQLADLVAGVIRRRSKRPPMGKNAATRTFQAIRIFINQELEEIEQLLNIAVQRLAPGGRLVVISFHSLEDRIVKEFFAVESGARAPRDPIRGTPMPDRPPRLQVLGRVVAAQTSDGSNRRERSAVMRTAIRLNDTAQA